MSSIDDKLNEVLNITPEVIEASEISTIEETKEMVVPIDKDAEIDFDTGRENLYKMLDKGNDAIDGILALQISSDTVPDLATANTELDKI